MIQPCYSRRSRESRRLKRAVLRPQSCQYSISISSATSPGVHTTSWASNSGQAVHSGASVSREYLNLGCHCTACQMITLSVMLAPSPGRSGCADTRWIPQCPWLTGELVLRHQGRSCMVQTAACLLLGRQNLQSGLKFTLMLSHGIWIAAGYGASWECEELSVGLQMCFDSACEDDFKEFFHRENKGQKCFQNKTRVTNISYLFALLAALPEGEIGLWSLCICSMSPEQKQNTRN